MITKILADELNLPTTTGAAVSFSEATVVRLVNTAASAAIVTVVETQSGTGIGSFTMAAGSVEFLQKTASHCVYASAVTVRGTKVGFTN